MDEVDVVLDELRRLATNPPAATPPVEVVKRKGLRRRRVRRAVGAVGGLAALFGVAVLGQGLISDDDANLQTTVDTPRTTTDVTAPVDSPPQVGRIDGRLLDGRTFSVRHDPTHGLCVVLDTEDSGCDDEGPVLSPTADPATARFDGFNSPPYEQSLAYGYLPADAVGLFGVMPDGTRVDGALLSAPGTPRIWALPLPSGLPLLSNTDADIFYVNPSGGESPAPSLP